MTQTPVPRDPGRDEDPPGVPAGPGDHPWLGSPDWRGVANPGVLDLLKSMIPPRTGPGIS